VEHDVVASVRDHSHSLPRNLADTVNRRGHPTPHQVAASIRDHSHFVLGVGWDPLDEYVVTVSSDRCGILGSWHWGLGSDLDLDTARTGAVYWGLGIGAWAQI